VAFSEAQQGEIEDALDRLAREDAVFSEQLEAELTREEAGQFIGLLVKNLENIQGDERDVIIMSVCYGPGPDGRTRMNFGPINQSGGERRLNVAFSRARHHMVLVSSLRSGDITNDYNDGANCLKNYLRYAAACSVGDGEGARRVLHDLCLWRDPAELARASRPGIVAQQIGQALTQAGYTVDFNIGMSDFRCDLACRTGEEEAFRLGVLVDADPSYWRGDLLEREVFKPCLLSDFGWKIARVLTKDWYEDRESVIRRLLAVAGGEQLSERVESDPDFEKALDDRIAQADEKDPLSSAAEGVVHETPLPSGVLDIRENTPRYFEFVGGVSRKFWEITLSGNRFSVRFGRIGTTGQEQVKTFEDPESARRATVRMVSEKLGKGYEEKSRQGKTVT
jgi:predicted DNA-binding WGR domain protein